MPDSTPSSVPATTPARPPLDRPALERVLARAAELQALAPDTPELLTEEQILEVGREVGLAPAALRQALAEERSRIVVPSEHGMTARLFGARAACAMRTMRGTPERLLAVLDRWMVTDELLQPKRRFPDRVTWEPRRGVWAAVHRGMNFRGRGFALARAAEVGATAVAVDAERTIVRLEADLAPARGERVRLSGATAVSGLGAGGAAAVIAAMLLPPTAIGVGVVAAAALLPAAAGMGGAYAIARQHAAALTRAQLALEQLLDRLEHGGATPATRPPSRPW
jgi:hypothetical protein